MSIRSTKFQKVNSFNLSHFVLGPLTSWLSEVYPKIRPESLQRLWFDNCNKNRLFWYLVLHPHVNATNDLFTLFCTEGSLDVKQDVVVVLADDKISTFSIASIFH